MTDESKNKIGDIFGIAPYGETLKIVSEETIKGLGNFLSRICMPMADEFGLMLRDKVRVWRLKNIIKILEKSKGQLEFKDNEIQLTANPRVVMEIMEKGSLQENESIQEMWAGLLTSSCLKETNDSNIIFTQILDRLTISQAKLINYFALNSKKIVSKEGVLETSSGIVMTTEEFFRIAETNDIDKLTAEVDHLVSMQLVETGFGLACGFFNADKKHDPNESLMACLKLSPLALIFYVRCQGFTGLAKDFYKTEYRDGMKVGQR